MFGCMVVLHFVPIAPLGVVTPSPFQLQLTGRFHVALSIGRPRFEELSFPVNVSVNVSVGREEFGVRKFSRLFFSSCASRNSPSGLALLIPTALLFYCVYCFVVAVKRAVKRRCCVYYKLVNPFFNFHSPCLSHQKGVSHLLHVQGLPIGSLFLSSLSHS